MSITRVIKLLSLIKGLVKSDYENVSEIMGEMHGLPQKLGQHFTLYRDDSFNEYFHSLCTESKVEELPIETILNRLDIVYAGWEVRAQASIGQVYKVNTAKGSLAVKVKYPGVERRIRGDFKTLRRMLWPTRLLPLKNSSLIPMLANLEKMVVDECDYQGEALTQEKFHRLFEGDTDICIPKVFNYNNEGIAAEWVEGKDLRFSDEIEGWFVERYLKFILKSLKELGAVHSDPHPGNFIISGERADKCLWVLDFGSVVKFCPEESAAVSRLLSGSYANETELFKDLELLGLKRESLEAYRPIIGDLVSILLEPFYYPGAYDFADWRMQYKINTLLASRGWEKPLEIPLKLILLFRALQGIYFYARKSRVVINWHETVKTNLG